MTTQSDKCALFHALHKKGDPLVLFNVWDAGSALLTESSGAAAIATSSWSVAVSLGYEDGEQMPVDEALAAIGRITRRVSLPVTADFESGYAGEAALVRENALRLFAQGVVGLNFEDQVCGGEGLYSPEDQAKRIAAVRAAAKECGIDAFINARTDLFFEAGPARPHEQLLDEAIARAEAYAEAGASGLFVPGLADRDLVARLCEAVRLPVNVMTLEAVPDVDALAELGVARISMGPGPYIRLRTMLTAELESITKAVRAPGG